GGLSLAQPRHSPHIQRARPLRPGFRLQVVLLFGSRFRAGALAAAGLHARAWAALLVIHAAVIVEAMAVVPLHRLMLRPRQRGRSRSQQYRQRRNQCLGGHWVQSPVALRPICNSAAFVRFESSSRNGCWNRRFPELAGTVVEEQKTRRALRRVLFHWLSFQIKDWS